MSMVALMYHDVVEAANPDASGFAGAAAAHYKLAPAAFAGHLDALAATGLRFGTLPRGQGDAALITFDDGGASAAKVAELLAARGMRGHFFITTARIGSAGFVTAAQLRAMHTAGHVIGSHSHTHPAEISRLDDAQLADEWRLSTALLADILGEPVTVASVPGGFLSARVVRAAAAAGIADLFTSEPVARIWRQGGCRLYGRYALWHATPAAVAAQLALGVGGARSRQWLAWNLKKPAKRLARPVYRWLRQRLLSGA